MADINALISSLKTRLQGLPGANPNSYGAQGGAMLPPGSPPPGMAPRYQKMLDKGMDPQQVAARAAAFRAGGLPGQQGGGVQGFDNGRPTPPFMAPPGGGSPQGIPTMPPGGGIRAMPPTMGGGGSGMPGGSPVSTLPAQGSPPPSMGPIPVPKMQPPMAPGPQAPGGLRLPPGMQPTMSAPGLPQAPPGMPAQDPNVMRARLGVGNAQLADWHSRMIGNALGGGATGGGIDNGHGQYIY